MSRFTIRQSTPDDLDAITRGAAAAWHIPADDILRRRLMRHLYSNPAGATSFLAADHRGEIIGHLGCVHMAMQKDGQPSTWGRMTECFIAGPYRIGGIHSVFFELQETLFDSIVAEDRLALVYGTFAEGDWWFLRHLCAFTAISTGLRFRRDASLPPVPVSSGVTVDALKDDQDFAAPILTGNASPRYDAALLRHRSHPDLGPAEVVVARRDGAIVAASILVRRGESTEIHDWAVSDGDRDAGLALLGHAASKGIAEACFWNASPWTCHLFAEAGFIVVAGDLPYLSARLIQRSLRRHWLSVNWQVSAADADRFAMPTMGVDEEVTRPPQPGTPSGRDRTAASATDAE